MAGEVDKNFVTVTFEVPVGKLPAAPELVVADRIRRSLEGLGASALNTTVQGVRVELDLSQLPDLNEHLSICDMPILARRELGTKGVNTIRDALVTGRTRMEGVPKCGPTVVRNFAHDLAFKYPGLALLYDPAPAYAAVFCRDLSEVPFVAIDFADVGEGPPISIQDIVLGDDVVLSRFSSYGRKGLIDRAERFALEFAAAKQNMQ